MTSGIESFTEVIKNTKQRMLGVKGGVYISIEVILSLESAHILSKTKLLRSCKRIRLLSRKLMNYYFIDFSMILRGY